MQLPGTEGVKKAVEAGLGLGMVSRYAVETECRAGVLRLVPLDGWRLVRIMNLVYRSQKYFSGFLVSWIFFHGIKPRLVTG